MRLMTTRIEVATLLSIQGEVERPDAENAYIMKWEWAGIVIPWPKGMRPKTAILMWAMDQMEGEKVVT